MRSDELLILNYDNFSQRAYSLFQQLSTSDAHREIFLRNPTGIIARVVFPGHTQLSVGLINQANRLLFSLLSNSQFMEWSRQFQQRAQNQVREAASRSPTEVQQIMAATLDRPKLYREMVEAVKQYADPEMLYSIMFRDSETGGIRERAAETLSGTIVPEPQPDLIVVVENLVAAVNLVLIFIFVTQIDFTPIIPPEELSREDLRRVSAFLVERLATRAQELRECGVLTSFESTKKGSVL